MSKRELAAGLSTAQLIFFRRKGKGNCFLNTFFRCFLFGIIEAGFLLDGLIMVHPYHWGCGFESTQWRSNWRISCKKHLNLCSKELELPGPSFQPRHDVYAYSPKPGQRFWNVFWDKCRLGRCYDTHGVGVLSTFLACAHVVAATPRMGWGWGGVVMLTFLAHMFLHLHTWSCGWGGGVAMLTFPAKYSIPPSLHTLLGNDEVNPKTFAVQKVAGELHWW